jgi:hypothetical protein
MATTRRRVLRHSEASLASREDHQGAMTGQSDATHSALSRVSLWTGQSEATARRAGAMRHTARARRGPAGPSWRSPRPVLWMRNCSSPAAAACSHIDMCMCHGGAGDGESRAPAAAATTTAATNAAAAAACARMLGGAQARRHAHG